MRRQFGRLSLVALTGVVSLCALAGAFYAYSGTAQSTERTTDVPPGSTEPPLMTQARSAGVKGCLNRLREDTKTIGNNYAVFSTWAPASPDSHIFQSVLSIAQADNANARSLGMLLAAPTTLGCETAAVQVLPLAMSCDAVQTARSKSGTPLTDFYGLYATTRGELRQVFVPAGPGACIAVSMSVTYAAK